MSIIQLYLLFFFVVLGSCVLITYIQLYVRVRRLSPERVNQLFACYGGACALYVWMFSAICAGAGFCVFTFGLVNWIRFPLNEDVLLPYTSFLFVSACLAPLLSMVEDRKDLVPMPFDWSLRFLKWMVIFVLFRMAMSAWWLFVWTALHVRWDAGVGEKALNLCSLWIAVHCTVFDFGLWGLHWFRRCPDDAVPPRDGFEWPRIHLENAQ